MNIRRGDIYYADLSPVVGSEQGGIRPVHADTSGLSKDSVVLLEQVRTIDKRRLKEKMGTVDARSMNAIDNAISISFGLQG